MDENDQARVGMTPANGTAPDPEVLWMLERSGPPGTPPPVREAAFHRLEGLEREIAELDDWIANDEVRVARSRFRLSEMRIARAQLLDWMELGRG